MNERVKRVREIDRAAYEVTWERLTSETGRVDVERWYEEGTQAIIEARERAIKAGEITPQDIFRAYVYDLADAIMRKFPALGPREWEALLRKRLEYETRGIEGNFHVDDEDDNLPW